VIPYVDIAIPNLLLPDEISIALYLSRREQRARHYERERALQRRIAMPLCRGPIGDASDMGR
jgi:hypothetical protein